MSARMARVDFYVLEQADNQARLRLACRLAEKAWQQKQQVLLLAPGADDARTLDDLLWTFRDRSFVPHEIYSQDHAPRTHVLISDGSALPAKPTCSSTSATACPRGSSASRASWNRSMAIRRAARRGASASASIASAASLRTRIPSSTTMSSDRSRAHEDAIPTLTDVVELGTTTLSPEERAALEADITERVVRLAEELLHEASQQIETTLFERVCDRLRARLPELIDAALRERSSRT